MSIALTTATEAVGLVLRRRWHPTTAPGVYDTLGDLDQLVTALAALAGRLADEVDRMTKDSSLRIDDLGEPVAPTVLADQAADDLARVRNALTDAAGWLRSAHCDMARLFHADDSRPEVTT